MLIEKVIENLSDLFPVEETAAAVDIVAPAPVEPTEDGGEPVAAESMADVPETEDVAEFGVRQTDYNEKGFHLDVSVEPAQVVEVASRLDSLGFTLEAVTGVDWLADGVMELVYDYSHYDELCRVAVRAKVDRQDAEIPTISEVYPGANWHERETHDFFGIVFAGHPDLTPLLLPEDADFHPLRKDFQA